MHFPTVLVSGPRALVDMMQGPSLALGISLIPFAVRIDDNILESGTVLTSIDDSLSIAQLRSLERSIMVRPGIGAREYVENWNSKSQESSDHYLSVMVARSPHDQAAAWSPAQIILTSSGISSVTPPSLDARVISKAQNLALGVAKDASLIGVMEIAITIDGDELAVDRLWLGPTFNGFWTIEGSRTDQFEQHLRAILDLPLGDPGMTAPYVVSGSFSGAHQANMYRPYLHLMARIPQLKFHQYPNPFAEMARGHVTATGSDLIDLKECISHAVDYLSGVIDE